MLLEAKSRHWENGIEYNLGIKRLNFTFFSTVHFTTAGHYIISDLPHAMAQNKRGSEDLE